jgi:FkbM family methyltransferase
VKKILKSFVNNKTIPVLRGSLRGIKLKVNDLVKGTVFFTDYEADKQRVFELLLKPDHIFFDIGANVGLHCYFIAKKYPGVKIYAFEPLPDNTAYIRQTTTINKFKNIEVVEMAVGSTTGESFFDMSDSNFSGKLSSGPTSLRVQLTTLDDFTQKNNVWPDIIKVDAEAAESEVLKGAIQLVKQSPPIFVVELHNPQQDKLVGDFFNRNDYILYRINRDPRASTSNILQPIKDPQATWPNPDGVWGGVVAIPKNR